MAAAKMTNSQFSTWVDANITSNGVGAITGPVLNEAFKNLALSIVPFAQKEIGRNKALAAGGQSVLFDTPFPAGTVYTLIYNVRDADGNAVGATVDPANQTVNGFGIEVPVDCFVDFAAIEKY